MNEILTGDSLEIMDSLDENSFHAIVTDPPYGLAFMGRDWDDFEPKEYQGWCETWSKKAKRVLKPGGHILAFSGNRTHHRLFSGVEDAGFEIRDTLTWHYGSGFPKALDVGKSIDKRKGKGGEREVVDEYTLTGNAAMDTEEKGGTYGVDVGTADHEQYEVTAPATEAAKKWDGWKTALKPATEFIVLGRKKFNQTVAENMQEYGTGALNIDGTRIDANGGRPKRESTSDGDGGVSIQTEDGGLNGSKATGITTEGRYPANVMFDTIEADRLDKEVGELANGNGEVTKNRDVDSGEPDIHEGYKRPNKTMFADDEPEGIRSYGDGGGPSRYFYTSKATKAERTLDGKIDNAHPTVKPQDLMEWLIKLVTAENQKVLDPFAGSGTTLKAAKDLNRDFIGIEKQAKWADVARVRVGLTPKDPSNVRDDNNQRGLESYGS